MSEVVARKRKNVSSPLKDASLSESKKTKDDEFTEIDFKVSIKNPNTTFKALEDFIVTAQAWSPDNGYDIVNAYCKSSGECAEIFHVLEADKRKIYEVTLVFGALEAILLRIIDDLEKYTFIGQHVANKILSRHMFYVYSSLGVNNKSNQIKTTLRLLTAMVMVSEGTAKAVTAQFDFNHANVFPLFYRRDTKDPKDVRTCLLHFVMSFLLTGSDIIIKQLVEQKGFLTKIFKGMQFDHVATIQIVLNTLVDRVIQSPFINKTAKMKIFNEAVLQELVQLYQWRGPSKWKAHLQKDTSKQHEVMDTESQKDNEESKNVAECVHKLLSELFCSFKTGINFFDKTYGTSGKNHNQLITSFLASFVTLEQPLVQEIIIKTLASCPDQLGYYLPTLLNSLTPRPSDKWISTMEFLCRVYEGLPDTPSLLKTKEHIPVKKFVQMLMVFVLPLQQVFNTVIQAIKHQNMTVRHTLMNLIKFILKKTTSLIQKIEQRQSYILEVYAEVEKDDITQLLKEHVLKTVPDMKTLMICWDKLTVLPSDGKLVVDNEEDSQKDIPLVSKIDHIIRLEEVLCLYEELSPLSLSDNPTDISKLMEGVKQVISEKDHSESSSNNDLASEKEIMPQLYLLRLLSGADARKLPWGKTSAEGHTLMYLLLEMMSRISGQSSLLDTTNHLVCQLLCGTGLFEDKKEELVIWLKHYINFTNSEKSDKSQFIECLSRIFITYISNPYPYIDKVSDFISEAVAMETADSKMETASTGTADSAIDAILEMDEDEIDEECVISDFVDTPCKQIRLPYTPLSAVALECVKKIENVNAGFLEYLACVLLDIFHTQIDPVPFVIMMQQSAGDVVDIKVKKYMLSWLPTKQEKKVKIPDSSILSHLSEVSVLLMKMYIQQDASLLDDISDLCQSEKLKLEDVIVVVKHCLLYIQTTIRSQGKIGRLRITLLQSLYDCLKKNLDRLAETLGDVDSDREQDCINDTEFLNLTKKTKLSSDILLDSVKCILGHPEHHKWFLHKGNEVNMDKKLAKEMSQCITSYVCQIFSYLDKVEGLGDVKETLVPYFTKLHTCFSSTAGRSWEESYRYLTILQHNIDFIGKHLDRSRQISLLAVLIKLFKTILEDRKAAELAPFTGILISLIEQLTRSNIWLSTELCFDTVQNLFYLMVELENDELYSVCLIFLTKFPHFCVAVDERTIDHLLECPSHYKLTMTSVVICHNSIMRQHLEKWTAEHLTEDNGMEFLPVIVEYVRCLVRRNDSSLSKETKTCVMVICNTYKADFKLLHEVTENTALKCSLLCMLIQLKCYGPKVRRKIVQNIRTAIDEGIKVTAHHIEVLYELLQSVEQSDKKEESHVITKPDLFTVCRKCLLLSMSRKQDRCRRLEELCLKILSDLNQDELQTLLSVDKFDDWSSFVKYSLRHYYRDVKMLSLIERLTKVLYTGDTERQESAVLLFEMVTSHSLYLPILYSEVYSEAKAALVDLLTTIVTVTPECCTTQHVGIIFGAYGATLSTTDQKILRLLYIFEKNGANMAEYRPYLWGPKAVELYSIRKSLGPSLWKQPTMEHIIDALDPSKLYRSVLNFPLRKQLSPSIIQTAEECKSQEDVYDPCFLLPLLSNLVSPDSLIDCRKFVECNCLSYVMAALSSHNSATRGAAYHILASYLHHLEGARFPEKDQILYLVQSLQRSIEKPNHKLACVITIFFAKAVKIMLKPGDHMYQLMNSFLLLKPSVDILNVPEFYKLFNSSALEYKEERIWILNLLAEGLRETADYRIFEKRYIFKLLLGYFDSSISDNQTQNLVLRILCSACKEKTAALDLTKNHGVVTWLSGVLSQREMSSQRIASLTDILYSVWFSMLGDKESHNSTNADKRCLPVIFSQEILLALQALLVNMREETSPEVLIKFLETLLSVLKHIHTTKEVFNSQGHNLHPLTLTLKDVCLIMILAARTESFIMNSVFQILDSFQSNGKHQTREKGKKNEHKQHKIEHKEKITSCSFGDWKRNESKQGNNTNDLKSDLDRASSLAISIYQYWSPMSLDDDAHSLTSNDALSCAGFLTISCWIIQQFTALDINMGDVDSVLKWIYHHLASKTKFSKLLKEVLSDSMKEKSYLVGQLLNFNTKLLSNSVSIGQGNKTKLCDFTKILESLNHIMLCVAESTVKFQNSVECTKEAKWNALQDMKSMKGTSSGEDLSVKLREYFLTSEDIEGD